MSSAGGRPSRRALLAALAAAGGAAALLGGGLGCFRVPDRPGRLFPKGGEAAARRLGGLLDRRLAPGDDETLWRRLEATLGGDLGFAGLENAELRSRVHEAIASELDRGEWVEVEGWQLAPTEVDLLVLAARQPVDEAFAN